MSWKAMELAPKDTYLLGYSAKTKRPFQMIWNVYEGRFAGSWINPEDEVVPTHFMLLPGIPPEHLEGWLPLEQAPRTGYCLGYDRCLKSPFVMTWHQRKQRFIACDGMGDEEPEMCMLLPSLADAFVELATVHQAEVSWYWTRETLHDWDHHIKVNDSVSAKVEDLAGKYGISDDTTYRTQFEGRLLLGEDREKVALAANELAQHLATIEGVMPLAALA